MQKAAPKSLAEVRAFLSERLGLRGPFWHAAESMDRAVDLGMIQIDSIIRTGLRNHEIVWVARSEAPVSDFYKMVYGERRMLETHYPIFATRRDWLPQFLQDFHKAVEGSMHFEELKPVKRKLIKQILANGPVSPGELEAERIVGGFNTVKATTKALEHLFYEGKVQVSGRTKNFHRQFDVTEHVAPELLKHPRFKKSDHDRFMVESAIGVLKIASRNQLAQRVNHHFGNWRGPGLPASRKLVDHYAKEGLLEPITVRTDDAEETWFILAKDHAAWETSAKKADEHVRLVAPLDNLLFNRDRFTQLYGFTYKFEAYTPVRQRRFYFALPILWKDDVVGLIDGKREDGKWLVTGLDIMKPVDPEALRDGLHRFARIAGAEKVATGRKVEEKWRKTLAGPVRGD
jgi:uncharacterized protein YcaQ